MSVESWLIILLLTVLLLIVVGKCMLLHWDIKKMTQQLEGIIENFGTNEIVRTQTHNKNLSRFATKINQLIHLFKQDQQRTEKRELNLKREITNISHDLRTPLTSIKGFTELLSNSSLTAVEKKEYLTVIQNKVDNLTDVVDLFYELSQLDSMDKAMVMEKHYLDQRVVETMLIFYSEFEKKQLHVQIKEQKIAPILADENALNRIVTNVIQNALTYSKSSVTIEFLEEDQYVSLRIVNDVEAFNVEQLQRIFDRTFRMDSSRTSGQLGLGLHIVQQLVDKQGGKVNAHLNGNEFVLNISFKKWS